MLTCHNRREKTLRCLSKLHEAKLEKSLYRLSVFLVDDGSTDGTGEEVSKRYPETIVIKGDGSLYWNRGMHTAWRAAAAADDFDFYLWLNDDTYIYPSAVSLLLSESAVKQHQAVLVGATQSAVDQRLTYGGFLASGEIVAPNGAIQQVATFNGNLVLVPKSVYQRVGNLDPVYHHAIGDIDYGLRAKRQGVECYIASAFTGTCEGHALPKWCLKEVPFFQRLQSLYSPLGNSHPYYFFYFERKNYGWATAVKHLFSIHLRVLFPALWKN